MKNLDRTEFTIFFLKQNRKIKNYKFDLFHDINTIMNFAYNHNNYRDKSGQIVTDKPIYKSYFWYIREQGTHLIETHDKETIDAVEKAFKTTEKFELTITANCDYLHNVPFCQVKCFRN